MNWLYVQVVWEKFVNYFEVEFRVVKFWEDYYVMDFVKVVEMCDENIICVSVIFGLIYNGEFEDVEILNNFFEKKNKEKG